MINFICARQLTKQAIQSLRTATAEKNDYQIPVLLPGGLIDFLELGAADSLLRLHHFILKLANLKPRLDIGSRLRRAQPNVAPHDPTSQILRERCGQIILPRATSDLWDQAKTVSPKPSETTLAAANKLNW